MSRLPAIAGVLLMFPVLLPGVEAQDRPARRSAVSLPVSATAARRVAAIEDLIGISQWDAAIAALADLEQRSPRELVEVEPGRAVSVTILVEELRRRLPAEGLAVLRRQIDPRAEGAFQSALRTGDEAALRRIAARDAGSSYEGPAIAAAAELAWEGGKLDQAGSDWQRLGALSPAARQAAGAALRVPLSSAEVAARLVLVELFSGDRLRAAELLRLFGERYPDADGPLAGTEGNLAATLHRVMREAANGEKAPESFTPSSLAWTDVMPPVGDIKLLTHTPLLHPGPGPLSVPLIVGDLLFLQGASDLRALRVAGGAPAWPTGEPNDRGVFWTDTPDPPPESPCFGNVRFACASDGGRLYAVAGWPISLPATEEFREISQRLLGFDIATREGKLLWSRTNQELGGDPGSRISGPPTVDQGRVYLPIRQLAGDVQAELTCLDGSTGETLWRTNVCGLLDTPAAMQHTLNSDCVTAKLDRVFLSGDFGATAALDAVSGRLQWINSDERPSWDATRLPSPPVAGRPAVCHRGLVCIARQDDRTVSCLHASTGEAAWSTRLPGHVSQLVDVRGGLLILSGDRLWGIDVDTGIVRWEFGFDDVEGRAAGQAQLVGDTIVWPLREELYEIDLATGLPLRRIPLGPLGLAGGHVAVTADGVLIAGPARLAAFRLRPTMPAP